MDTMPLHIFAVTMVSGLAIGTVILKVCGGGRLAIFPFRCFLGWHRWDYPTKESHHAQKRVCERCGRWQVSITNFMGQAWWTV